MPDKNKRRIDELVSSKPNRPQEIQRGSGMRLSTDAATEDAHTHKRTEYQRISRGYKLREDLVKQCKQVALDDDRNLYEVMEDAIEEYLDRRKQDKAAKEQKNDDAQTH